MQRASEERVALVTAECSDEKKISQEDDEKKHKNISVFPYLRSSRILFLQETSREGALQTLVEKMALEGVVPCKEKFLRALIERERLVSTGIGMGVAIPHAKMGDFSDFFIAIGIQKKRGIGWKSLDRAPVRLIFMIGGPDRRQSELSAYSFGAYLCDQAGVHSKKDAAELVFGRDLESFSKFLNIF